MKTCLLRNAFPTFAKDTSSLQEKMVCILTDVLILAGILRPGEGSFWTRIV